jgi:NADPH-dependent 2,4-dienoyl-CoA reductase/sulfur reductase-like enzyme
MNRMRFPLEIISEIRLKAGKDFPVIFRISGDELVPGGRNIEGTKAAAMILETAGIDAIHVSAGVYGSEYSITPPAAIGHGWITSYAEAVKKVVGIPVITVGRITDPFLADAVIASGKADLVAMGRASLADPGLPKKAAVGHYADINPCIGCMQGCIGRISQYQPATCLVNPALGKEAELAIKPAAIKKVVFVAGGGPAGMEAAMVAAKRGHQVHLFEKSGRLGGRFYTAAIPPSKGEIAGFIAWQIKQVQDHGVKIHLQTELTADIVENEKPDVVVVATGSLPAIFPAAAKGENIVNATDVLEGKSDTGRRVAVVGGGMIGSETANHLAQHGRKVTIIEMLPEVATDVQALTRSFLLKDLAEKDVKIYVNAKVKTVLKDEVMIERDGNEEKLGPFDTIVLAIGLEPSNELSAALAGKVDRLITIGDAAKIANALEAVEQGYMAGLAI